MRLPVEQTKIRVRYNQRFYYQALLDVNAVGIDERSQYGEEIPGWGSFHFDRKKWVRRLWLRVCRFVCWVPISDSKKLQNLSFDLTQFYICVDIWEIDLRSFCRHERSLYFVLYRNLPIMEFNLLKWCFIALARRWEEESLGQKHRAIISISKNPTCVSMDDGCPTQWGSNKEDS